MEDEISRENPSRNCRDKGDRLGQKGVPSLVWLLAGPHLEAACSVIPPSGVTVDFLHRQLV